MKRVILNFIVVLFVLGSFSACKEKCINPYRNDIFGQWKLIEVVVGVNYSQLDTTDYSEENIIFDFQRNNKLVVSGNIFDSLSLFDDFQEGVHFYEYSQPECSPCLPGPNLGIYKSELGMKGESYFCTSLSYEETMVIYKMSWMGKEGEDSDWGIKLIKLN